MKKILFILLCFILMIACNERKCKSYTLFFTTGYLYDTLSVTYDENKTIKLVAFTDPTSGLSKHIHIENCSVSIFTIKVITLEQDTLLLVDSFQMLDSNILVKRNGNMLELNSTNEKIEFR